MKAATGDGGGQGPAVEVLAVDGDLLHARRNQVLLVVTQGVLEEVGGEQLVLQGAQDKYSSHTRACYARRRSS